MSSLAGRMVFGCHGHYSAAKWALEGLSEALAFEMAEFNVRVALIEPGSVPTPAWEKGTPPPEGTHYGNSLQRLAAWATYTMQNPASTLDVAEAVTHAIESETPQFRYLVGQDAVVTTLRNAVRLDRVGHAFLFVGPASAEAISFPSGLNVTARTSDRDGFSGPR